MLQLIAIRLENVRVFRGEQFVRIGPGLTVLMGRNNAGKSTVLRAPFLRVEPSAGGAPLHLFKRQDAPEGGVGLQFKLEASECKKTFDFEPRRLQDVQARLSEVASFVSLANLASFHEWELHPVVEIGVRWISGGRRSGTLRITSESGTDWVEVGALGNRARIQGEVHLSNAEEKWFETAIRASLSDQQSGLPPAIFAFWEHQRDTSGWIDQSKRRVIDTEEERLQETLVFLRMKHPAEFEAINRALQRALPEFTQLDFIDVESAGFGYRPGFVSRHASAPLAREAIGAGAWSYLCILTAARAAKATGACVLLLDEPHLYMHPGLERLLLDELLDSQKWHGKPLQIVASTHSPAFVDAAAENGTLNILDWLEEDQRANVHVTAFAAGSNLGAFEQLIARPSDLLYADRIVFVEGPSDAVAIRILARERCNVRRIVRYVPLRETDAVHSELARFFSVIVRGQGLGFRTSGLLVLDGDKRRACTSAWEKLNANEDPSKVLIVVWADGERDNDFESVFCDADFLVAYFAAAPRNVKEETSRPVVAEQLSGVAYHQQNPSRVQKGCHAVRKLHAELLRENDSSGSKIDDLEGLMQFYVDHPTESFAAAPRTLLQKLEAELRNLGAE